MLTKEDLQLLSTLIDDKLQPINDKLEQMQGNINKMQGDISQIKERLDELEESNEIIKYSTNELVRWVDTNFRHKYPFPVDRDVV